MTLHAFVGLLVALYALAMLPAHATGGQHIPAGQPIPENIRWVNATATGVDTSASATWTNAAGNTTHHKVPVRVTAATLGALANGFARRALPWVGAALTLKQVIEGAGWAISELQGQVQIVDPGVPRDPIDGATYLWCLSQAGMETRCTSTPGGLTAVAHLYGAHENAVQPCFVYGNFGQGTSGYQCNSDDGNYRAIDQRHPRPQAGWPAEWINANPGSDPGPIANEQIGQLIKANPQVVNAILIDPETGAPIRTPELMAAMNDLRRSLEAANGLPPGTDLVPSEDFAESTPSQTDWPEFCGWAKRMCDWMFTEEPEPEHPDLPYVELDPQEMEDYDSGLGNGVCPAPYTTAVLDGEFEIQWDGLCGFVEYLRPLVIGLAWVVAAFMVANSAQRK